METTASPVGLMGSSPPPPTAAVKRAVLKFAPKVFTVEVLPPTKHGNAYSYGLRISPTTPTRPDNRSIQSERSWTSSYEVWRRWEDCLHFQDLLEEEYAVMAEDKRRRLKKGKGVKKDGIYVTSDFAASWDSLPAGPDYKDIATDIHVHLPKLSKKGGLFRPNQATIAQRGKEFEALIESLMNDTHPTLVEELRETAKIRDFFGFWRRDQELHRKMGLPSPILSSDIHGLASMKSGLPSGPGSFSRSSFFPPFFFKNRDGGDGDSIRSSILGPSFPESVRAPSPPPLPTRSPLRQRQHESSGDDASCPPTPPIVGDMPMRFILSSMDSLVESPTKPPHREVTRPPRLNLAELPLSPIGELAPRPAPRPPAQNLTVPTQPRRERSGTFPASRDNRNCRVLPNAPNSAGITEGVQCIYANSFTPLDDLSTPSPRTPDTFRADSSNPPSASRLSFTTTVSSASSPTFFSHEDALSSRPSSFQSSYSGLKPEGLRVNGKVLPVPEDVFDDERMSRVYPTFRTRYRGTQSSTSLVQVERDFMDDLLPPPRPRHRPATRAPPSPLAESDDLLDSFFGNMSLPSEAERRSFSGRESITCPTAQPEQFPAPFQHRPPGQFHLPWSPNRPQDSPDYSRVHALSVPSAPPASTLSPVITVKATYDEVNILMKVDRTCNLAQLRKRIFEKLSENESILMSECFILAYPKPRTSTATGGRPRSQSTSTIGFPADPSQLNFIVLEPEWTDLVKTCGPKLQLFLLDP